MESEPDGIGAITFGTLCDVTLLATSRNPILQLQFPRCQVIWMFYETSTVRIDSFVELFRCRFLEEPFKWVSVGRNIYHLVELALQGLSEKLTVKLLKCDLMMSPGYSSNALRILEYAKCKKIKVEATHNTSLELFNRLFRTADGAEELVLNVYSKSLRVPNHAKIDIVRINQASWFNNQSLRLLDAKQIHLNCPCLTSIDVRMFLSAWASRDMRLEVLEIRHERSLVFEEIKFGLITKRVDKQKKFQKHKFCSYLNDSTDRADIVSCNGAKSGSMFFSDKFFIFLA